MSYFDRPDSPPPRAPSPEQVHTPLPSPHLRAQRRKQQHQRASSPLAPPGLAPPRTLLQSRSFDQINRDPNHHTLKRRTRSNLEQPNEPAPNSSSAFHHRRTTSVSTHPCSPPLTPGSSSRSSRVSSPVPPVPPLPDSARSSPLFKPHLRNQVTPIYLPELNDLSPVAQRSTLSIPPTTPVSAPATTEKKSIKRLPSLFSINTAATGTISSGKTSSESTHSASSISSTLTVTQEKEQTPTKQKSTVAMTCLKFFTMHRHGSKQSLRASANAAQC
ncbi:hypothetical protein FA13DRAFT_1362074 [Coprinellus micaceus]|uniref:Uncharacterized protein n=1 Tax=Coprinellus micaceus TaxID=71717 RepID=A0A4Y7TN43_COPMI|nr:hypothetical protein FA13DRAFT_1362074 [Coprinellus micaceus]